MKFQLLLLFTILALQLSSADDKDGADDLLDNEAITLADRLNEENGEESPVLEEIDDTRTSATLGADNKNDEIAELSIKEKLREAILPSRVHSFHTYHLGHDFRHTLDPSYLLYPWFREMNYHNPQYYDHRYGLYPTIIPYF